MGADERKLHFRSPPESSFSEEVGGLREEALQLAEKGSFFKSIPTSYFFYSRSFPQLVTVLMERGEIEKGEAKEVVERDEKSRRRKRAEEMFSGKSQSLENIVKVSVQFMNSKHSVGRSPATVLASSTIRIFTFCGQTQSFY